MPKGVYRALCVLPVTAILHHAVFYRPTCILNPFAGNLSLWLTRDPSLPYAVLVVVALWDRVPEILARRFFFAFLPLTLWLWDLPGTGRVIHRTFHDGKLAWRGFTVHTRDLYVFGSAVFAVTFVHPIRLRAHARSNSKARIR
jgi:hypothetical protein